MHGTQRIVGEKQQTQKFWNGLVRDVLGRPDLEKQAEPEYKTPANGFAPREVICCNVITHTV